MKNLFMFLCLMLCGIALAESYLCAGDMATGFLFDEKSGGWVQSKFKVKDNKYVIAPTEKGSYKYKITKVGEDFALVNCKNDFDKFGFISCSKLWVEFNFNKNNGRYLRINEIGYYNVLPEENGTTDATSHSPMLEIGTCSLLDSE